MRMIKNTISITTLYEISRILQWRGECNYLTGLSYDYNTQQILVNKDMLMRAIQLANPGQKFRDIRLITNEEFKQFQDRYPKPIKKENIEHKK